MGTLTTSTSIAGTLLVITGFYLWFTQNLGTKLFELSNDLIGAGIFALLVAMISLFEKWGE